MPPTRSNSKNPEPVVTQEDINKLGNDITKAVDLLRTDILEIRDAIIKNLLDENKRLQSRVSTHEDKVDSLEKELAAQDLYCRRNNVEVSGISSQIKDDQLETHVIKLFNDIGVEIKDSDIEACHRLPSKENPKKAIIRFVNRKNCFNIIKNRKKLPPKIYANANLNKYYRNIAFFCRKLKRDNKIFATWYDSTAVIIKTDEVSLPKKGPLDGVFV